MKCSLDQASFVRELDFLRRTESAVLLSVPPELPHTVTLTATSSRCSMTSLLGNRDIVDRRAGSFPITSTKLDDVARTLEKQILAFEHTDRTLCMSWPDGYCRMIAPWTFTQTTFVLGDVVSSVELEPAAFMALLRALKFCYPPDNEPRIPGLKFDCDGNLLTVTSTNGTALGIVEYAMERPAVTSSFVLPGAICDDLMALLRENKSEPLQLQFYAAHLRAACGHRSYITKVADAAAFPNVARFFEQARHITAECAVGPARQALRRATAACTYNANESFRVRIALTSNSTIRMETLESSEEIGTYDGSHTISFVVNSKMLNGVLEAMAGADMQISGSGATTPWLFTPKGGDNRARFILAPMAEL